MDFRLTLKNMRELKKKIDELASLFEKFQNENLSEGNTELFFILPFLKSLGYDTSNPEQISSQYPAVPGDSNTGRVDFALLQNGDPIIFVEGKKLNEHLDNHYNQIRKYFNNCRKVDFVILTNGNEYRFYTDLDYENMLDKEPFLKFGLREVDKYLVEKLTQFTCQNFDTNKLRNQARKISRREKIISFFKKQFSSPTEKFLENISEMVFSATEIDYRNAVRETLPDVLLSLRDVKPKPPPVVGPDPKVDPPPVIVKPDKERDIFSIGDLTGKKLDYFRFQNEVIKAKYWKDMFLYVFRYLSQEDPSKLISIFNENRALKITRDENLIPRGHNPKPIRNDLFISTNHSNNHKQRYLKIALSSFDMKDALWVKVK